MNNEELRELKELIIQMTEKWEKQLDGMIEKLDKLNEKLDRVGEKLGIDVDENVSSNSSHKKQKPGDPGYRVVDIDGNSHMISWESWEFKSDDN